MQTRNKCKKISLDNLSLLNLKRPSYIPLSCHPYVQRIKNWLVKNLFSQTFKSRNVRPGKNLYSLLIKENITRIVRLLF